MVLLFSRIKSLINKIISVLTSSNEKVMPQGKMQLRVIPAQAAQWPKVPWDLSQAGARWDSLMVQEPSYGKIPNQCRKFSQDQEGLGLGTDTVPGLVLGTCAPAKWDPWEMGRGQGH